MRKTKVIAGLLIGLAVAFCVSYGLHRLTVHREQLAREQLSTATLAKLSGNIHPGMLRTDSEARLHAAGVEFFNSLGNDQRFTVAGFSDLIPLGKQPSGVWYCGPVQFGVMVTFDRRSRAIVHIPDSADVVHDVQPYLWYDDCL